MATRAHQVPAGKAKAERVREKPRSGKSIGAIAAGTLVLLLCLIVFPETALAQGCPGIMWWPYLHLDQNCGLACDNDYANCLSTYTAFQCIARIRYVCANARRTMNRRRDRSLINLLIDVEIRLIQEPGYSLMSILT